jgi:hypothetical protein
LHKKPKNEAGEKTGKNDSIAEYNMIYEKLEDEAIESEENKKNIVIYLNIFLFFLIDFVKDFGI